MTNEKGYVALIDKISIPKSSMEELSKQAEPLELYLKTMPGLIRQEQFEQIDLQGNLTRVTIAVWSDSGALAKARDAVQAKFYHSGANLPELMQRLNVKIERGIYNVK